LVQLGEAYFGNALLAQTSCCSPLRKETYGVQRWKQRI
jgi:hypothetical protein